ncbi:hypothetical protein BGZ70_007803 [Mortierella alpina]|uniref:GATA-type domain-containing protein n=1 Tax=Mortierella alpina TaxID=64518 RepID=A0A9P6M2A0_MORAP|nr:hypothetical protein BGZ70_007803 [Mortierella alpina]
MMEIQDTSNRLLAKIDGEDEELEIIGGGISSTHEHRPEARPRPPMRMPNLKYDYPAPSVHNFSPGTSLIFNAYKGNSGLLSQAYMATGGEEDDIIQERLQRRLLNPQANDWPLEQQNRHHKQKALPPTHADGESQYLSYEQSEHRPYRASYDRSFPPYMPNGRDRGPEENQDYASQRDPRDPRDLSDPRGYSRHRDYNEALHRGAADPLPPRTHEYHPSQHPHEYAPRSRPPHASLEMERTLPQHATPPSTQSHNPHDPDLTSSTHAHGTSTSNRYHPFQSAQARTTPSDESWGKTSSAQRQSYATAAIDIPQPHHHRHSNGYTEYDHRDSADDGRQNRYHQHYSHSSQHPLPNNSSAGPSNFRPPNVHRPMGPRYALTRVNYRMIFDYASEIRECLLKGKVGTTDRLLYNAEILSKVFMGCRVDRDPKEQEEEEAALNPHQIRCTSCNIVKTPEWRKGPLVWGKISRSKAALAKSKIEAAKGEPSTAAGDSQMVTVAPTNPGTEGTEALPTSESSTPSDVSRKRERDQSSVADVDDAETQAREDDLRSAEAAWKEATCQQPVSRTQLRDQHSTEHLRPSMLNPSSMTLAQQQVSTNSSARAREGDAVDQHPPYTAQDSLARQEGADNGNGRQNDQGPFSSEPPAVPEASSHLSASSPFDEAEGRDGESSVAGRKLALSYLLG